jgi:hypothetical protein
MARVGELIVAAIKDAWASFLELTIWNLLWFVGVLLVVTAPAAMVGLSYATHQLGRGEGVSWRTFFVGARQFAWLGYKWGLLNLAVIGVAIVNAQFYAQVAGEWASGLQGILLGLYILWLLLQLYVLPVAFQQQRPSLRLALRNSAVIWLRNVGASLGLIIILALLVVVTSLFLQPAWAILTMSLYCYLVSYVMLALIDWKRPEELEAEAEPKKPW